jgi:hypothetical protein
MNYELELLETLADWLETQPSIIQQELLLKDETKRLEKAMLQHLMNLTNKTQLNTYLQINLHKLVQICDQLYDPHSVENNHASHVLKLLLTVRSTAKNLAPQNLVLPILRRKSKSEEFKEQWSVIKIAFENRGIDRNLIEITGFALYNFEHAKERPNWSAEDYVRFYCDTLLDSSTLGDEDQLVYLLIRLGYNYSRFTAYCCRKIKSKTEGKTTVEKLKALQRFKKELRQLELLNTNSFDTRKLSIVEELLKWINEEIESLFIEQSEILPNPMKLNTTMRVLELAYWEKLQYDNGVYEEINLDSLSEKIAFNFSSKFQEELSAPSIKSKFYPKERSIIQPIEELLVKMLADVRLFLK